MARNRDQGADIMFIKAQFPELAAAAWRGYQKGGVGFLLICCDDKDVFPATKNTFDFRGSLLEGSVSAYYIPAEAITSLGLEYPTLNMQSMLDAYDAHREIIVVIQQQKSEGWSGYRYVGYPTPVILYAEMAEQFQLNPVSLQAGWCEASTMIMGYTLIPQ